MNHVCERLKRAIATRETYAFQHDGLLNALFRALPLAALNGLCGGDHAELNLGVSILADIRSRATPLNVIPDDALLAWCDEDSVYRYPAIAGVITIATPAKDGEPLMWSNIARGLLERAPDQIEGPKATHPAICTGWMERFSGEHP